MKKSILFFVVFTLTISLSAQNKNDVKVTEKARATFIKLHPTVKDVKWSKEGKDEFEAEFKQNDKAISVVIDENGNYKETESEISKSDLPKGVEESVAKSHSGWTITETAKIVDAKGNTTFEVQITKAKVNKDLIFTKEGKPITKEEMNEGEENDNEDED